MNIYKLNNVSKIYNSYNSETKALDDISLDIKSSEVVVILGPSGSGKSTMLNILSGIDKISLGEVYFEDKRIDQYTDEMLTNYRKDYISFIFQSYNLISCLTVKENIELGSKLAKNPIDINDIIEKVGLTSHKNKFPYQLSGGQMQRVAIARAIVKNPKVLFCDEPTGALDESTGKNVLNILQEINSEYKTTIIIVTHNPSISKISNTTIKMNSGKISEIIKNEDVLSALDIEWA